MALRHLRLSLALLVLSTCLLPAAWAEDEPQPAPKPTPAEEAKPGAEAKPAGTAVKKKLVRQPTLWVVEGTPKVYLFGTIHVPDARVVKLMPVVRRAFDTSDAVYTELRMDMAGLMRMQQRLMALSTLPQGETLTHLLGEDLHARVAKALPPFPPMAFFENRKPWMVNMMLLQVQLKASMEKAAAKRKAEEGIDEPPADRALDAILFTDAQKAGKEVDGLETIDDQLKVFDELPLKKQVEQTLETVEMIEKAGAEDATEEEADPLAALLDMWLAGDADGFVKLMEEEASGDDEELKAFMDRLGKDRNIKMAKKLREMMAADPKKTYFIAVGAAHMPGKDGLVKLLEAAGHTVRRVKRDPAPAPSVPAGSKEPAGAGK